MGREVKISLPINKIVSLVPSQTELLFDLGLGNKIVGRTKFCIHPKKEVEKVKIVGGTKTFHIDQIKKLQPDLIIGSKEENQKELIQSLEKDFPIWLSNIITLPDAIAMINSLSELLEVKEKGDHINDTISKRFSEIPKFNGKSVLYLIWSKPYMGVGNSTFINSLLENIGLKNVLSSYDRYPQLTDNQIVDLNPEYIFLSSEPFPFKTKHEILLKEILPDSRIIHVNGEMFSWYGSRLLQAPGYFKNLHSRLFKN